MARERLLHGLSSGPVTAELRARTLGLLFVLGGLLSAVSVLLDAELEHEWEIWVIAGVAVAVGLIAIRLGPRLGTPAAHALVALGVLLINLATLASGIASLVYAVMFFWVVAGGAFFFSRRAVLWQTAWALLGYGVVLALLPDASSYSSVTRWLLLAFSLTVCAVLVSTVFERLHQSERARRTFFVISSNMLAIADRDGRLIDFNKRWTEELGRGAAALSGRPFTDLIVPEDREQAAAAVARTSSSGEPDRWEARVQAADGEVRWLSWRCVTSGDGELLYLSAADVTDSRRAAEAREELLHELDVQAREDPLTGLPNRRWLDREIQREIGRASRQGAELCAAMIDLDHFKRFNDAFGHVEGDRFLVEATGEWRTQLRAVDFLARYGGEEFVALLPDCSLEQAEQVMARLASATPRGQTCSVGIARWEPGEGAEELIERADGAMYAAKAAGRNRIVLATEPAPQGSG